MPKTTTRVALEVGKRWTFATALDWPGWCRRGKGGDEAALEALQEYADRYRALVGPSFTPGELTVVGRVDSDMHADFGAPGVPGPWDDDPLPAKEADRLTSLLEACWAGFDAAVAASPAELRKGPRGGGRDRDKMADHVREAERSYARKVGVAPPPRTPWDEQRGLIAEALRHPGDELRWPVRYCLNRMAWHVTDHLWEMQDRAQP